eukprot:snap_masked-scaffold_13-processed-gene-5.11-mRNA-1 protein AED:1.00 eAED:1.00 QI:0/0/0/0/1/1/2/0/76
MARLHEHTLITFKQYFISIEFKLLLKAEINTFSLVTAYKKLIWKNPIDYVILFNLYKFLRKSSEICPFLDSSYNVS